MAAMVICGHEMLPARRRRYRGTPIEKVRFGVAIREAFNHDIPATLLVLLLKINKEGPLHREVWRRPGNKRQVQDLIANMQRGCLVNVSTFNVYTAASVVTQFLGRIPGGVFGEENEHRLFAIVQQEDPDKQRDAFHKIIASLPINVQHLLVLLFGTFRSITDLSHTSNTHMSPTAVGISVAPSLFLTCVQHGQKARIEDLVQFKIAGEVTTQIIKHFGYLNLFPRENYEYYARITGRRLIDDGTQFSFDFPAIVLRSGERVMPYYGMPLFDSPIGVPSCSQTGQPQVIVTAAKSSTSSLSSGEHHSLPRTHSGRQRQSIPQSAGGRRLYKQHIAVVQEPKSSSAYSSAGLSGLSDMRDGSTGGDHDTPYMRTTASSVGDILNGKQQPSVSEYSTAELQHLNVMASSTKSLGYLEWVHERQVERMHTRSEWFLTPSPMMGARSMQSVDVLSMTSDDEAIDHSPRSATAKHYFHHPPLQPRTSIVREEDEPSESCVSEPIK